MKYNNTNFSYFFRRKGRVKHVFIDNYMDNEIKQFNGQRTYGSYGECDVPTTK